MCAIDWGLVVNGLAAIGSVAAAVVALVIAGRDRGERKRERESADQARAELAVVTVYLTRSPNFAVDVTNYGTTAILGLTILSADFATNPSSSPKLGSQIDRFDVVDCDRTPATFYIDFVDGNGQTALPGTYDENRSYWAPDGARPDPAKVTVTVQFRDAEGTWWHRSNVGSAVRTPGEQPALSA